jgi:aryl sulfotransferase
MKRLVWLASFPKSGNTWTRLFLNAYLHPERPDVDINEVEISLHAGNRDLFDRVIGLEASDLTPAEIDRYRPDVYRQVAVEADEPLFVKVHDCWRRTDLGAPLFPLEVTAATVYLVRDPRAVAPSYANHYGLSLDDAIVKMNSSQRIATGGERGLPLQLPQIVDTWSAHVSSWLDQDELPVHLVRYEDLHAAPETVFSGILAAAGIPVDGARVAAAVAATRFERLRAKEETTGFKERLPGAPRFFRRGQAHGWREELSPAQIAAIEAAHGPVMARLGYPLSQ